VRVEAFLSPSDFAVLRTRDLADAVAVVFDVLRATSTFVTALGQGAEAVIPVETIEEALEARRRDPSLLLAGERNGLPIGADLTGSVAFDLGNSPREFTAERVAGRTIVSTTTNGTRALRACAGAREILAASFLNLDATARWVSAIGTGHVAIVCAGTFEETALEDVLAAGAFVERCTATGLGDGARIARETWKGLGGSLEAALAASRNGAKLLSIPDLAADVPFCARRDAIPVVARMDGAGALRQGRFGTGQVEIPSRL
jgi:2-phosphosulfolactate phosphatase